MLKLIVSLALVAGSLPAWSAQTYQFDVLYSGNGIASLAGGSADPTTTTLYDGDSFSWTISAQGADLWTVVTGGEFFPLMAFGTLESGTRTGDFSLTLSLAGAPVFDLAATDSLTFEVHVGTNDVALPTGLRFDTMHLQYTLTSAIELADGAADPDNLQSIGTTPSGLLPIFGAPELNTYSPGIVYAPVPEPANWALLLAGAGLLGLRARRRRA